MKVLKAIKRTLENIIDNIKPFIPSKSGLGIGFLSTFLYLASTFGQNTISGKITKLPDNRPALGRVTLEDNLTHQKYTTLSDSTTGNYSINIPSGTFTTSFEVQKDTQVYHLYTKNIDINSDTTIDHPGFPYLRMSLFDTTALIATKKATRTQDYNPNHRLVRIRSPVNIYAHKTDPPDSLTQPGWAAGGYINAINDFNAQCKNLKIIKSDTDVVKGITIVYVADKDMPPNAHGYLGYTERDNVDLETKEIYHSKIWINTEYNPPSDSASITQHEILWGVGGNAFTTNTSSMFYLYGRPPPMHEQDALLTDLIFGIPIGYDMFGYKQDSLVTRDIRTGVKDITTAMPEEYSLLQNYPNPFNPSTNFKFSIAHSQFTTLKVYDVLGREVATLVNEVMQPGEYSVKWNARLTGGQAEGVTSGVYFYRLQSGNYTQTRKLLLLR